MSILLAFAGDSRVIFDDNGATSVPTPMVAMCWVRINNIASVGTVFGSWLVPSDRSWDLVFIPGIIGFRFAHSTNGVNQFNLDASTVVVANTWYHVVMYHAFPFKIILVNGVNVGSAVSSGAQFSGSAADVAIGNPLGFAAIDGDVEDCRVYNRAPSVNEILTIYNFRGRDAITDGLIFRQGCREQVPGTTVTTAMPKDLANSKFPVASVLGSILPVYEQGIVDGLRRRAA